MLKLRHPCCVYCGAMFSDGALAGLGKLVPTVLDMYFKKKMKVKKKDTCGIINFKRKITKCIHYSELFLTTKHGELS